MKTLTSIAALQEALQHPSIDGLRIGFVPTMGNLHDGHLSLVEQAQQLADIVVVSIFVNPLQFGANEDLDKYPRTLVADQEKLAAAGVDFLFAPTVDEIYPNGQATQTQVCVPVLTSKHCGSSRPGHFDGVSTVVNKLFNIVQPDVAVFGQKDFQQLAVIRKMVEDLCIPVEIVGVPTHRAEDGLALSSRNQYLSVTERNTAPLLYRTLINSQIAVLEGKLSFQEITDNAVKNLESAGFVVDYLNICDAKTLDTPTQKTQSIAILAAALLGKTRLIDNVYFPLIE